MTARGLGSCDHHLPAIDPASNGILLTQLVEKKSMSWLRTLLRVASRAQKLVGSDLAGNKYFEQLREGGKTDTLHTHADCVDPVTVQHI